MSNRTNNSILRHFVICLTAILISSVNCSGQNKIKIGDKIPDSLFQNIYNYPTQQLRLSDFKAKLILLDFWSPACSACLASFPKLDSLQKLFKGQIQIVLVNKESLDSTRRLFLKRKFLYKPHLPFITGDRYFNKLFSVYGLPAEAWLGSDGKYFGYSEGSPSIKDIEKFLNGTDTKKLERGRKRKYISDPIDSQYRSSVMYYSFLSKRIPGVGVTAGDIGESGINEMNTIIGLYELAYDPDNSKNFHKPGRTIIETNDSLRYFRPESDKMMNEWFNKYLYYYYLLLPKQKAAEKYEAMKSDLYRYFSIKVTTERRMVKSWTLVRTSRADKIKTKGGKSSDTFIMNSYRGPIVGQTRSLENQPYSRFSIWFGSTIEYLSKEPFFDLTGYAGNIDISFDGDLVDKGGVANWQKALSNYDLQLVEKEMLIDVLVLNDKK